MLAAESCWVNPNRNPGRTRAQIEAAMLAMVGGKRMIWIDGLAGNDITDGHIDTLARFVNPTTILMTNRRSMIPTTPGYGLPQRPANRYGKPEPQAVDGTRSWRSFSRLRSAARVPISFRPT